MTRFHLRFTVLALSLFACRGAPDPDRPPETDDPQEDTGTVPTVRNTGDTGPGYLGPPYPSTTDPGSNERCILLFGGSDRVIAGDQFLPFKSETRTIQAWIRTNWGGEQVALSYGRSSVGQGFTIGVDGGTAFVDANGTNRVSGSIPVDDDEWHHVIGIWDGNNAALLVDGAFDGTGQLTVDTQSGGVTVGNLTEGSNDPKPFVGWIDDVRIFDTIRDYADIEKSLDGADDDPSLLLWYDFEGVDPKATGANIEIEDLAGSNDGETGGSADHPRFPDCR